VAYAITKDLLNVYQVSRKGAESEADVTEVPIRRQDIGDSKFHREGHIVHPGGRLIPFDTYDLFYRDALEKTRLAPLRRAAEAFVELGGTNVARPRAI
jgi:hypothetical protein